MASFIGALIIVSIATLMTATVCTVKKNQEKFFLILLWILGFGGLSVASLYFFI